MLTAAYHILKGDATYAVLALDYFERRSKTQTKRPRQASQIPGLIVEVGPAALRCVSLG